MAEGGAARLTPGMTLGSQSRGTFRVVLQGRSLTYRGYARQHVEEEGRHLTWTLSGKEVRGTGRAHAEVRARFRSAPDGGTLLRLTVLVEGRGRIAEASEAEIDQAIHSVLGRFRRAASRKLEAPMADEKTTAAQQPEATAASRAPETTRPRVPQPARVEIIPPEPESRGRKPGAIAAAALLAGIGILVYRRMRRR